MGFLLHTMPFSCQSPRRCDCISGYFGCVLLTFARSRYFRVVRCPFLRAIYTRPLPLFGPSVPCFVYAVLVAGPASHCLLNALYYRPWLGLAGSGLGISAFLPHDLVDGPWNRRPPGIHAFLANYLLFAQQKTKLDPYGHERTSVILY